jgi:hypothetical protein
VNGGQYEPPGKGVEHLSLKEPEIIGTEDGISQSVHQHSDHFLGALQKHR